MIHLERIRHRILKIHDLILPEGTTAVIGPNGAGKSTLLRLCAGVEEPENGSLHIDGALARATGIGWVDENPERTLLFDTVSDEIASPLRFQHVPCHEVRKRVSAMFNQLGIDSLHSCRTRECSAGEKVLVALGAALIQKPQVLILDECDSHLDPGTEKRVGDTITEMGLRHILLSTQHMETAANADWVVYLEKGRVLSSGLPDKVFSSLEGTCFYPLSWRAHP
jgi:energy-coupling factor transport system ATP-binding protein